MIPAGRSCRVCGAPLTRHEGFAGRICSHWRCRWADLDDRLREHRYKAARALRVDAAETYKPVVVPAWGNPAVLLLPQRRRTFRGRMAELAEEAGRPAGAAPEPAHSLPPGPDDELLARVCAVCEGACCYDGREAALHDAESLRMFLAAAPGMTAADAVAAYLSHIPEHGYENSCVYHTTRGCVLPPAMRAPICGGYECRGRKDMREHLAAAGARRGYVVVRHDGAIVRGAFIDGAGIRHYPPRRLSPGTAHVVPLQVAADA